MVEELHGPAGKLVKTYLILMVAATNHQTITYGEIARQVGEQPIRVRRLLDPVAAYCAANQLPDLTTIVVRADTRLPAEDHYNPTTWHQDRDAIYNHPWLDYAPPRISDFAGQLRKWSQQ